MIFIIIFVKDVYGTWPRVIEPIIDRKNHQHVRLCCPNGEYVNVPISKNKHGTYVFLIFCFSIEFNHFFFSALHRLSHHAAPGDIFPVTGELVEDKTTIIEKDLTPPRRRRAFRT